MNTPAGYIVSWKVPDAVDVTALRAALRTAGLDEDLAPDLKPASVVSRTSSYLAKARSGTDHKLLSRAVGYAKRQITLEEVDGDDLKYTREAAIALAADGFTVECDEPSLALVVPSTVLTVKSTRTSSDITRIIQKVVEAAGSDLIQIREQGGAYFIPSGHGIIGSIATLLEGVGGDLTKFACTLGHGSDESIANTIADYMLKQVSELKESIDGLNEAGIRSDVKSRRLSRVAELRERLSAYATLIGIQGERVSQALTAAEASLLAKLGTDDDDEPQVVAA